MDVGNRVAQHQPQNPRSCRHMGQPLHGAKAAQDLYRVSLIGRVEVFCGEGDRGDRLVWGCRPGAEVDDWREFLCFVQFVGRSVRGRVPPFTRFQSGRVVYKIYTQTPRAPQGWLTEDDRIGQGGIRGPRCMGFSPRLLSPACPCTTSEPFRDGVLGANYRIHMCSWWSSQWLRVSARRANVVYPKRPS